MFKMSRTTKIFMVILAIIWLILAPSVMSSYFADTPDSGEISYQLDWEWGEATPTENGWQVVNDLGYTVNVEQGYIVSYSATLLECPHSHNQGLFSWLLGLMTPAIAHAGHGTDGIDPASINTPHVESLAQPETLILGTVTVPEPSYCQGHYLVARGSGDTIGLPDDVEMYGTSLYVAGTYQAPDSDALQPFAVQTSLANGAINDLLNPAGDSIHAELSEETIAISITRRLDVLFDGVDFITMDDAEIARSVLWALIDHTQLFVISGKMH